MDGNIPVLFVEGEGLAEAWEKSLLAVYEQGCDVKTEYDKADDPPSKDSSMTIVVRQPLAEPMIHKDFPGGPEDLQEYVLEVIQGIKDHWVRQSADKSGDTRWEYTYHQRLFGYTVPGMDTVYDQIKLLVDKLVRTPYTRRAQAITWKVWEDNFCYDPACLQSIWCRMLQDDRGDWFLNTNIRFRSNDAYKAAFMNMFAFIQLQQHIAGTISKLSGKNVNLGRYVHQADSYHIYGSYLKEFRNRFIQALQTRTFAQRTMRYDMVRDMMAEAIPLILDKVKKAGL